MERNDFQYAIEPQRNIGTNQNTQHIPCEDSEAEIFTVYRLNGLPGDADWLADFWTSVEAEKYMQDQLADERRREAIFTALQKI
jgi:hypothetical protein